MHYLFFFLSFLVLRPAVAQEDPRIVDIRKEYSHIREHMRSFASESVDFYDESTEGAVITGYKEKGITRLMDITWYGESGKRIREYYYKDHHIFFVFDQVEYYNQPYYIDAEQLKEMGVEDQEPFNPEKSTYEENRYYFHNDELIRWIDPEKQQKDILLLEHIIEGQKLIIDAQRYYMLLQEREREVPGEHTRTDSPSNYPNSNNNPFGNGGDVNSNGAGDGVGHGQGVSGNYPPSRIRLIDPSIDHLQFNEYATVTLILMIDEYGNVQSTTVNKAKTTTTNQVLLNKVMAEVQKQVKYNRDPGAPLTKMQLTIRVSPN